MRPFSSFKRKNNHSEFELNENKFSKIKRQNSNYDVRKNDFMEDIFIDGINKLKIIWDDLGVTPEYRNAFISNILKIDELDREDILEKEKINYIKLKESLMNLKKEINLREFFIKTLKKFITTIENHILDGNTINQNSQNFTEITNIIIRLRYNSLNIVNLFFKINKTIYENPNKWNFKLLFKKYFYDPNYLNKIKDDLKFLKYSILNKFIEMNNGEIDPFLTNCAPGSGIINNKIKIPLNEELMKAINESRYILIEESTFSHKEKMNKNYYNQIQLNTDSNDDKATNNCILPKKNYLQFSFSPRNFRNKKLKSQNNSGNINMSREILLNKKALGINNYNDIFYKNSPFYRSINNKRKKYKLTENPNNRFNILNNYNGNKKTKIIIERDEIGTSAKINNILLDEKNKNKILNKENIQLKRENNDYKIKYLELKKLYDKMNTKAHDEEEKRNQSEKDVNILQIRIKELTTKNKELEEKIKKIEKPPVINEIKNLLEVIDKKNEEITQLKNEIENLKKEKDSNNYKIDFYKGNISNLVNTISEKGHLEKLPDYLKRAFLLDESIYTEEFYFKGIFPKIIISYKGEGNSNINGICSLSYENNENLSENLNLKINCIYGIEDLENNIILMINYIKENMSFNKLVVYLLYDNIDNKFIPNKEAKDIFEKKLGFKWLCVTKKKKKNQRYIKLSINKEEENANNIINGNNFLLDNYTLITLNKEEDENIMNKIKDESKKEIKMENNTYINLNSIYSLLYENPKLKIELSNENKKKELEETKQKLWKFILNKFEWNLLEEEEKKNLININIDNSLFKEIELYNKNNNIKLISDLQKKYISINFETNYSILIDDVYYNRISANKIKILKETKTNSLFFLIPSIDNTVLFYISEVNSNLKAILLDSQNNIYEQFLEFQPSTQKELFNFSKASVRDISYIPQKLKTEQKIIYLPSFVIKTHLYSFDFKDINKNIKISSIDNNEKICLNTVDEYINIEFKPDNDINKSFSIIPVEDQRSNVIIKDSFIIGIFANDIINNDKLPLMQFLYITKEHFLTKDKHNK